MQNFSFDALPDFSHENKQQGPAKEEQSLVPIDSKKKKRKHKEKEKEKNKEKDKEIPSLPSTDTFRIDTKGDWDALKYLKPLSVPKYKLDYKKTLKLSIYQKQSNKEPQKEFRHWKDWEEQKRVLDTPAFPVTSSKDILPYQDWIPLPKDSEENQ